MDMVRQSFRLAEAIVLDIAFEYGLTTDMLRHGPRTKHIARARQVAMKRLRTATDLSWREIGMVLGRKGRAWLLKPKPKTG